MTRAVTEALMDIACAEFADLPGYVRKGRMIRRDDSLQRVLVLEVNRRRRSGELPVYLRTAIGCPGLSVLTEKTGSWSVWQLGPSPLARREQYFIGAEGIEPATVECVAADATTFRTQVLERFETPCEVIDTLVTGAKELEDAYLLPFNSPSLSFRLAAAWASFVGDDDRFQEAIGRLAEVATERPRRQIEELRDVVSERHRPAVEAILNVS